MDHVLAIAAAAEAADGASPLDEAARIALADGVADVLSEDDAFALVHDGDLTLVVRPTLRGRGLGSALLGRVEASYDGELVAWSHGNHPAAARLADPLPAVRLREPGRGLGRLLTLAGLHHLEGLGVEEVLLYVESDNAPAVAVYSRLGFEHAPADTHVQYRRRLRPPGI